MEIINNLNNNIVQNIKTVIGEKSSFIGSIEGIDTLTIEGMVVCTNNYIQLKDTLSIAKEGRLKCEKINIGAAYINGAVLGNVYASQRIILQETSIVYGNLYSPEIITYKGARFYGRVYLSKQKDNENYASVNHNQIQRSITKLFE